MSLYEETLTPGEKQALGVLGPLMQAEGFYLAGGTAIAVQLGHRRSVDLDWFTEDPLEDAAVLAQRLQVRGAPLTMTLVRPGTLHAQLFGVRITCLEYRYRLLAETVPWSEYGCRLASLEDLACMKLSAIAQCGAKKDFLDLYALATRHRPLPDLMDAYRRKYQVTDTVHVLYGLAYFEDADRERMPRMLWDLDWREVKRSIRHWVREIAR